MRVLLCMGTRPEIIKMAPLYIEMKRRSEFEPLICFSGQHREVAGEVLDYFKIKPDLGFCAMREGQSLSEMNIKLLNFFDEAIEDIKPDIALVHGDTATAFSAALSAFYKGVKIGHIEAGLRTYSTRNPFPEEMYRVSIDAMAGIHFAPTEAARKNLEAEGRSTVFTVGNTVIDALKYTVRKDYSSSLLCEADGRKIVLLTTHRRENIGEKMHSALLGVGDALREREDVYCILPAHPNPLVREEISRAFENIKNIKICEPLPMYDFHNILARSHLTLTDSGGIVEEAAYLGIPIFILRDTTERAEAIEGGNARLLGTDREDVKMALKNALDNPDFTEPMRKPSAAFGDGRASEKIADLLRHIGAEFDYRDVSLN